MNLSRFFLFLLALFAAPLAAQPTRHMSVALVAESSTPRAGGEVALALVFRPQPGWHGYWLNPGESGLAPQVEWRLPAGAAVGATDYPVPQTLLVGGLMNYVFEGEHALLFRLKLPAVSGPLPIAARVRYLVCTKELCVPEQAEVALRLTPGSGQLDAQAQFDGWRSKLPVPLGSTARFARAGDALRLAIPYPATADAPAPRFFPATKNVISDSAEQRVERRGDLLLLSTKAAPGATAATVSGILALGNGRGLAVTAEPGPVPELGGDTPQWRVLLLALGGALLGGLILNVMPCVFPILSLKALSLAKAGGDERAARREALAYTAGAVFTLTALGALMLALKVGWAFQLQDPRVVLVLLVLTLALTLNLLGLFELPVLGGGVGAQGGFATGALAAFVATPCTGPFMGAALGAALVLPPLAGLAVFAGLGLGLALPFLAVGFVPALRRALPRPGPWMLTFRRILALPMALTALWLGWLLWRQVEPGLRLGLVVPVLVPVLLLIALGYGQRRGGWARQTGAALGVVAAVALTAGLWGLADNRPDVRAPSADAFSETKLAQLRAQNRPVFVYFTADWCVSCKVNERVAIAPTERTMREAGVTTLVGDWTNADPAITRFLREQGRAGVPLYLYYPPGGAEPRVLPQVLTPAMLRALGKA